MNLSKHFNIDEFTRSFTAERLGIDNTPTELITANISKLCREVLDPLRTSVCHPIVINSGYRCPRLNEAVHGVSNSNHMRGLAADIPYNSIDYLVLSANRARWHINELIHEHRGTSEWIHVSVLP